MFIDKVLYIYWKVDFKTVSKNVADNISPNLITARFKIMLSHAIKSFITLFKWRYNKALKGNGWLYVVSQNNYDSLSFIKDKVNDCYFVHAGFDIQNLKNRSYFLNYPLKFFTSLSFLVQFPVLAFKYKTQALRIIDRIFLASGSVLSNLILLKLYKPKYIVFSNDHNLEARSMLMAANYLKIPTFYIQHAAVNKRFPPLAFSLSFLEGQDSLSKYQIASPNNKVELVGNPKFDKYVKFRKTEIKLKSIGICSNLADNRMKVEALIRFLKAYYADIKIFYRPHPRENFTKFDFDGIVYSNPANELVFDFLKKVNIVIAGNSSIHLEAVLLNIYSISYNFTASKFTDYYGFVKKGLSAYAKNNNDIVQLLNNIPENNTNYFKRAYYYNALVGTEQEGKSGEMIIKKINDYLKK